MQPRRVRYEAKETACGRGEDLNRDYFACIQKGCIVPAVREGRMQSSEAVSMKKYITYFKQLAELIKGGEVQLRPRELP
jgi:hypothetical protein